MEAGEKRHAGSSRHRKKVGKAGEVRSAEEEARRREVLRESLRDKLELEKRALQVVERLLDENVGEDFLSDCVRLITPANYRDAVEERSISKLCGYPACSNTLTNVPSQQYKISTRTNKVYDITERKCFCCNFCFKASKHLEVQIPKSPLWLRKDESPPDIKLMKNGDGGSSGLEVTLTDRPVCLTDVEDPGPGSSSDDERGFVSSVVSGRRPHPSVHWGDVPEPGAESRRVREAPAEERGVVEAAEHLHRCDLQDDPEPGPGPDVSEVGMSKRGAVGLKDLLKNHARARVEALRRTLVEWRTEETVRFLDGPSYTSQTEVLEQREVQEEEEELDEDDLESPEEVPDGGGGGGGGARGPFTPDFETLKTEAEMLHGFHKGVRVLPEEVQNQTPGERVGTQADAAPPPPPIDSRAQHAVQRRIVVEKLCRSLKDVVGPLGVSISEIISDVSGLVRTFRFTNVNIVHRPPEWTLIALVLLSSLAGVSPSLREALSRRSSVEYVSSLVEALKLKDEDLRSLVKIFRPGGDVRESPSDPSAC